MTISEVQLHILMVLLRESLSIEGLFTMPTKARQEFYHELISQLSNELVEVGTLEKASKTP